jgi:hypothetical protein
MQTRIRQGEEERVSNNNFKLKAQLKEVICLLIFLKLLKGYSKDFIKMTFDTNERTTHYFVLKDTTDMGRP